jgi:hypothetical protein
MAVAAAVYLFMALPLSRPLWEALPLIDFVQFPWRFVGRAALPIALLTGVPFAHPFFSATSPPSGSSAPWTHIAARWSFLLLAAALLLLITESIPNLYPRFCAEEPFPTIETVHTYERASGLVGVDPEGSYFPRTVQERPSGSPLEADYAAGRTPQRFDTSALPDGAEARDVLYDRFGVSLTVESPEPFTARYLSFAFPGWSVRVDDEPVPITPENPSGLITFDVPAGTHEIVVEWGATPLRWALVAFSALSAVGAIVVVGWAKRRPPAADTRQVNNLSRREWIVFLLLGVALIGLKLGVDRVQTPLRAAGPPPVDHPMMLSAGEMRLDGFNLSRNRVPAGETFDVKMAWTAVAPPAVDYQSEVSLVGPDGLPWSQKGTERPRLFEDAPPTRLWSPGEWGWDSREVQVLSGAPPGIYDIVVTLFDKATLAPTTFTDPDTGEVRGPSAVIGQIEVVNPATPPDFMAQSQYPVARDFPALGLRLLGYNQDRTEAVSGDSILLTLFWECVDPALCDQFTLRLEDESGATAHEWRLPVIREDLPPGAWPDHGRLRGQHIVQLPADLTNGRYRFMLEDFPLGQIAVTAPDRRFTPPPLAQEVGAAFTTADGATVATLTGIAADSTSPSCHATSRLDQACSLSLVWRAESETPIGYHVFVHLVDETGNILAQSDTVPGNWTRPTTGWLPGEYVTDVHTLTLPDQLPAGPLSIRIGLYNPDTGQRLSVGNMDYANFDVTDIQ